jgi:L-lactate dehydrogenase complex protein LldF
MHVIFLDNGRTSALASEARQILGCIRCGACLNVCPVYRQASGHAYRSVYPGPVGAVLSPLLAQERFSQFADLPRASSLCGACHEVCPVNIPIEELLVRLRYRGKRSDASRGDAPSLGAFASVASEPFAWQAALFGGGLLERLPSFLLPAPLRTWQTNHTLPTWRGGAFRRWWREREARE